jgi:hypothetical protein
MHEPVEQRSHHDDIAEQFRPVIQSAIRGDDGGSFLMGDKFVIATRCTQWREAGAGLVSLLKCVYNVDTLTLE